MITIIHGDDIAASRNFFLLEKQKAKDPISFEGKKMDITSLTQAIDGDGLFTTEKNIFIEELLSIKNQSSEVETIISFILKRGKEAEIVIWEGNQLAPRSLMKFKQASIHPFNLPKDLFLFLDSLRPHTSTSLSLFHKTLQTVSGELVFYMIVRHMRILLAISTKAEIDEIKRLSPWQATKLNKQSGLFPLPHLKKIFQQLFQIEYGAKTGTSPQNLIQSIDLFLLSL